MVVPGQASPPVLRVLAVVATQREAARLVRALRLGGGAEVCRVTTPAELRHALAGGYWDAVLCAADVATLPVSVAFDICADLRGSMPFVALLGARDEALATGLLGQGVHNWVRRDRPALIAAVVERELREARIRAAMEQADAELRALLDITRAVGEAEDFRGALAKALAVICRLGDWDYGESWSLDGATGTLRLLPEWVGDPERFADFRAATAAINDPAGKGFIARVWAHGRAEWLSDLSGLADSDNDHVMLRLHAALDAGLGAGFAVPIRNGGTTLAVMAFFVDVPRQANENFVSIAEATAAQLGGVVARLHALDEAAASRRQLEAVADNLPGLIFQRVMRPDGTVHYPYFGGRGERRLAYARQEYPSLDAAFPFMHPEDRARVVAAVAATAASLEPFVAEHRNVDPDGAVRWVEVHAATRRLADGSTVWDGVAVDVTERHEAETERDESRRRLEVIAGNLPGLIYQRVLRPDGTVYYPLIGGAAVDVFDIDSRRTYSSTEDAFAFVHPEDRAAVLEINRVSQRDLKPFATEYRALAPDGTIHWIEVRALPRRLGDGGTAWEGVAVDVTARHEAEAALAESRNRIEAIVDNIPGLLFRRTHRPDGGVAHVQIVGHSVATGTPPMQEYASVEASLVFAHPDDIALVVEALAVSQRDMVPYHAEFRVLMAEGGFRWVEARALPRREADGSTTWDGVALDVTARHDAEAALAASQRQLESIAGSVPGLMFRRVQRPDGTVVFPYLGGATASGLGPRKEIYADLADSLYFVHPDDRPHVQATIEASIGNLEPFSVEYRAIGDDGRERWFESRVQPRKDDDGSVIWDGVAVDVTGRRAAEAELADSRRRIAAIAENVPGLMFRRVRMPDGRYAYPYASRSRAIPIAGHAEPLPAEQAFDFVHPEDRSRVIAEVETSARGLVPHVSEFRVRDDTGAEYWVESRSLPRRLLDGATEWDGLVVDVSARHKAEEEASESRRRIEAIAGSVPGMLFERVMLPDGRMYHPYTSGTATSLFRVHRHEPVPLDKALGFVHPDEREEITAAIVESARTLAPSLLEYRMVAEDGAVRWIESRSMPRRMADGGTLWHGVAIDVTARREAEEALADSRRLFAAVAQNVPVVLYRRVLTADGRMHYTYVSRDLSAALRSGGGPMPADEALRYIHAEDRQTFLDRLLASARDLVPFECEFRVVAPDGRTHWIETRSLPHRLADGGTEWDGIAIDVTGRHEAEERATWLARYDQLTGLPNRALFEDFVRRAIQEAAGGSEQLAVLLVGLDRFRLVNETLGQAAGDAVLQAIGRQLDSRIGERSVVARQSGDEYLVLLREEAGVEGVSNRLRDMLAAVAEPVDVGGETVFVTASIGAAMYPDDGIDPAALVKHAELALHEAKAMGPATCRFFTATLDARAQERFAMQARLRRAIDEDEFAVYYQPQIDLVSGNVIGAEALVRWRQGTRIELPGRFVPLAEETGLIVPLGRRVLRRACADWAERFGGKNETLDLSVNVSARQMADEGFLGVLREALKDSGLAAGRLKLEITESALMAQDEQAAMLMRTLQDIGIRLAIDDFGTGYSSLQYLARLPVETLKVDQSFVRVMAENREAASIVQAIIDMAHRLDMGACAEGVETSEQEIFLRAYHCDACQGFLYAPALPIAEFVAFREQRNG